METEIATLGVEAKKKIAILGLPNTGKSLIFGQLTGEYTIVANYPFTTVEIKRRDCHMNDCACQVIDTPGLHCLSAHSKKNSRYEISSFTSGPTSSSNASTPTS